jgi:hypothetical protein
MTTGPSGLAPAPRFWSSGTAYYVEHHFQRSPQGRYIALVGMPRSTGERHRSLGEGASMTWISYGGSSISIARALTSLP